MNKLDIDYQNLLKDILENGVEKKDRTGAGTISVFGRQIRHNMKDGFPLLTTKKMYFRGIATELIWFLKGYTNIKYLVDNDCHIWNGDAYKHFFKKASEIKIAYEEGSLLGSQPHIESMFSDIDNLIILSKEEFINKIKTDDEFAKNWGELGPVYGAGWRNWGERRHDNIANEYFIGIDQIANLINDLKTNPDSRRLMVSAWNVGELDQMVLPPCHYGFQVYTRELSLEERKDMFEKTPEGKFKDISWHNMNNEEIIEFLENIPTRTISLMWNQRSVDTFLGLPFNIASYGLLLEIIAKEVNMVPDQLIGNLGDVHLYTNHIEQAKEQIGRELTLEERRKLWESTGMGWKEEVSEILQNQEYNSRLIPKNSRTPFKLPTLKIKTHLNQFKSLLLDEKYGVVLRPIDFILDGYESHPKIEAPLNN